MIAVRLTTLLLLLIGLGACTWEAVEEGSDLIAAAQQGQAEQLKALLNTSPEVDVKSGVGSRALMAAALNGHSDIVQILAAAGADANARMSGVRPP